MTQDTVRVGNHSNRSNLWCREDFTRNTQSRATIIFKKVYNHNFPINQWCCGLGWDKNPSMKTTLLALILLTALAAGAADRPSLLNRLKDEHARGQKQWIYNDYQKAVAMAKATGKPIFVTFRCVPCEACESFDAEVAKNNQRIKNLAEKQFISLRLVEMKGVDLSQFQFDYDLSWAAMFINADGTVYGRYGTQSAAGADAYNSVESLEKTMYRVLSTHANYSTYKKYLTDKRGKPKPYKTALQMPGLSQERKEKFQLLTERKNCIHCHNIHDAENNQLKLTGKWSNDALWRYPLLLPAGMFVLQSVE